MPNVSDNENSEKDETNRLAFADMPKKKKNMNIIEICFIAVVYIATVAQFLFCTECNIMLVKTTADKFTTCGTYLYGLSQR